MLICAFLLAICPTVTLAGFDRIPSAPRMIGMGGIASPLRGDIWSAAHNPALLNTIPGGEGSVYYVPDRFGIPRLGLFGAGFALNVNHGGGLLAIESFGCELYREYTASAAFGYSLEPLSAGVSVRYYTVSIRSYGGASAFGLDAGVAIELIRGLTWGLVLVNVNSPVIGKSAEPIPRSISSGLTYEFASGGIVAIGYRKEDAFQPAFTVGAEYPVIEECVLRCGVADAPGTVGAGIGIHLYPIIFDYAASFHQELGLTHAISVSFRWGKGKP